MSMVLAHTFTSFLMQHFLAIGYCLQIDTSDTSLAHGLWTGTASSVSQIIKEMRCCTQKSVLATCLETLQTSFPFDGRVIQMWSAVCK